jgi:hypothetical protein
MHKSKRRSQGYLPGAAPGVSSVMKSGQPGGRRRRGLGGFFLPALLGGLKNMEGGYAAGLVIFALAAACAMLALLNVGPQWRRAWARAEIGASF